MLAWFPDHTTAFWIYLVCAVTLIGIAKAGFGAGVGVLATPLMALTMPVAEAAALLLPLLIISDGFAVANYRFYFDRRNIKLMLPGAIIGIILGGVFFSYFIDKEQVLKIGIGILAVAFVIFQLARSVILGAIKKYRPHALEGVVMGAIARVYFHLGTCWRTTGSHLSAASKAVTRLVCGNYGNILCLHQRSKTHPLWDPRLVESG